MQSLKPNLLYLITVRNYSYTQTYLILMLDPMKFRNKFLKALTIHEKNINYELWYIKNDKRTIVYNHISSPEIYGKMHRDDGPAFINSYGLKIWFNNGKFHRDGGPSVIKSDDDQAWCQNGKLHRNDGPAFIKYDGAQAWYQYGKLHRTDGPAHIDSDGSHAWCQNGDLHRYGGPALIDSDGSQYWYQNGIETYSDNTKKIIFISVFTAFTIYLLIIA